MSDPSIEVDSVGFVLTLVFDQLAYLINLVLATDDQEVGTKHILIPDWIFVRAYDVTYEEALDESAFREILREFGDGRAFMESQLVQLT